MSCDMTRRGPLQDTGFGERSALTGTSTWRSHRGRRIRCTRPEPREARWAAWPAEAGLQHQKAPARQRRPEETGHCRPRATDGVVGDGSRRGDCGGGLVTDGPATEDPESATSARAWNRLHESILDCRRRRAVDDRSGGRPCALPAAGARYFNLCENEFDSARLGWLDPQQWAVWHSAYVRLALDRKFSERWRTSAKPLTFAESMYPAD